MKNYRAWTPTIFTIFLGLCSLWAAPTLAEEKFEGVLNKLLAPGPLFDGHKSLEHKDCLLCHEVAGGVPNKNCIDCHKGIKAQVRRNAGYHGLMKKKLCVSCHKDHKGRDYDSVKLNEKTFDHRLTGFPLEGAHQGHDCQKCHKEKRSDKHTRPQDIRWFGVSSDCISCHKDDDVHRYTGKMAEVSCGKCHQPTRWKDTKYFDHKKETGYDLVGAHGSLTCAKCHAPKGRGSEIYSFPKLKTKACLTCHSDHHKDNLSPKFRNGNCTSCHNQSTWNISKFNHKITGFVLKEKHSRVECAACHKQSRKIPLSKYKFAGLSQNCASCHEDYHGYGRDRGRKLGPLNNCSQCHTERGWAASANFNHNTQTLFPIEGRHRRNACFQCHTTKSKGKVKGKPHERRKYRFNNLVSRSCETCHKSPHSSSFHAKFKGLKCENCHSPESWSIMNSTNSISKGNRNFHDKTRFPLTGQHRQQSCDSCHKVNGKDRFKFPNAEKGFCINCHESVHRRQFTPKFLAKGCGDCHTTSNFTTRKPFDHNQTGFKLTGAHRKFAKTCNKCHVPSRNRLPTSPPKVAHIFKFAHSKKGYCESCHLNVHKNQFSQSLNQKSSCSDCHTTTSFKRRLPFNHNYTRFRITGKHLAIRKNCFKCHIPTKAKLPTRPPKVAHQFQFPEASKNFCEACHRNEHKDMFSQKFYSKACISCHKTQGWEKLKPFNHNQTRFPRRYKHKQVECKECHIRTLRRFTEGRKAKKGRFKLLGSTKKSCSYCHQDPHRGGRGQVCSKCHTEAGWLQTEGFHKNVHLNGVHLVLNCDQCHLDNKVLRGGTDDCLICHGKDDPHNGALQDCNSCHSQTVWEATYFTHDLTQFPLRGVHRLTDCRSCHNQGNYQLLPTDCVGCHATDASTVTSPNHSDPRFQACEQCHNTFNFSSPSISP